MHATGCDQREMAGLRHEAHSDCISHPNTYSWMRIRHVVCGRCGTVHAVQGASPARLARHDFQSPHAVPCVPAATACSIRCPSTCDAARAISTCATQRTSPLQRGGLRQQRQAVLRVVLLALPDRRQRRSGPAAAHARGPRPETLAASGTAGRLPQKHPPICAPLRP